MISLRASILRVAIALAAALTPGLVRLEAAAPPDVAQYLVQAARFSSADMSALENGTVVALVMPGSTDTEVMVVAAVKIRATRDQTVDYYGRMISYVDGKVTTGFGRFSTPPVLNDVAALSLDSSEIAHLKSCKPGDCDLRIGGAALGAIRSSVDWNAPGTESQVNARIREAVLAYINAYRKVGDEALVTYNDRSQPVSLKDQWRGILAASPYIPQYSGPLRDYLAGYPGRSLQGATDVLYWVQEHYTGLKPVVSIVHGVIFQDPATPTRVVVAQKQLYASHYYDGSLAVAVATETSENNAPVTYLVYANRSRGDLLKGGFGGLRRGIARSQAKTAAEQTLGTIKSVLENPR